MLERFGKANILNVLSVVQEAVPVAIYKFLASRSPVMSCCGVRTYVPPSNAIKQFFLLYGGLGWGGAVRKVAFYPPRKSSLYVRTYTLTHIQMHTHTHSHAHRHTHMYTHKHMLTRISIHNTLIRNNGRSTYLHRIEIIEITL